MRTAHVCVATTGTQKEGAPNDTTPPHHRHTRISQPQRNRKGLPMALTDDQLRVLSEIVGRETDGEQGSAMSCLWVMALEGVAPVAAGEVSLEDIEAALLVLRKEDEADDE